MDDRNATIISNERGISTRVCPRGLVSLYVGHTCITLHREDFLELAEVVTVTEKRLLDQHSLDQLDTKH